MAAEPTLTGRTWTDADVLAMLPAVDASPWVLDGAADVLHGAALHEFRQGGQRALIATTFRQLAHGRSLEVVGLVSKGARLQSAAVCAALDDMAAELGADQLVMATARPHLARAVQRAGWVATGQILRKGFHRVQQ